MLPGNKYAQKQPNLKDWPPCTRKIGNRPDLQFNCCQKLPQLTATRWLLTEFPEWFSWTFPPLPEVLSPLLYCFMHHFVFSLPVFQWCQCSAFGHLPGVGCIYIVKRRQKSPAVNSIYSGQPVKWCIYFNNEWRYASSSNLIFLFCFSVKFVIQIRGVFCTMHFITTALQHMSFYSHTHTGSFIMTLFSTTIKSKDI